MTSDNDGRAAAASVYEAGQRAAKAGRVSEAARCFTEARNLLAEFDDASGVAGAQFELGRIALRAGDWKQAIRLLKQARDVAEEAGDDRRVAMVLVELGRAHAAGERLRKALKHFTEAAGRYERLNDHVAAAEVTCRIGMMYADRDDVLRAMAHFDLAVAAQERNGDVAGKARTLHHRAGMLLRGGRLDEARSLYEQSLRLAESVEDTDGQGENLANLGVLAQLQGRGADADARTLAAGRLFVELEDWPKVVKICENLAHIRSDRALAFEAQGAWLAVLAGAPVEVAWPRFASVIKRLGVMDERGPLLASAANQCVARSDPALPETRTFMDKGFDLLVACLLPRDVTPDTMEGWLRGHRLDDPTYVLPEALRVLEALVDDEEWLVDRAKFEARLAAERSEV